MKSEYYKIQARAFLEYSKRFLGQGLKDLFDVWAESKDFSDKDRAIIFDLVKAINDF